MREATSETYGPRVYFSNILLSDLSFCRFCFEIYYSKNPKIRCCTFSLLILFRVLFRSIYPISYKVIYHFTEEGLTTPLTRRVASICSLCAGVVYVVVLILLLVRYLCFITEGNTYHRCAASSLPLWGNTDAVSSHVKEVSGAVVGEEAVSSTCQSLAPRRHHQHLSGS